MKYFIQTYGCAMNTTDSERVASVLERLGYEAAKSKEETDMLVLNTCSVRQKAEDRVLGLRKVLKALKNENEELKVGITGCMVRETSTRKTARELDEKGKLVKIKSRPRPELIEKKKSLSMYGLHSQGVKRDPLLNTMPELDLAFRIEDVARLPDLLSEVDPTLKFKDKIDEGTLENYFKINPNIETKYSVFVPVMTGCDKFCTYCIVPYTRGREVSRDYNDILKECEERVEAGAVEITLVGQTVNTYGLSYADKKSGEFERFLNPKDWAAAHPQLGQKAKQAGQLHANKISPFAALLRDVDKLKSKGLRRLRFTSPHPRDFHDDVIAAMAESETVCPYFHMPVQAGSDPVLRRMNRNYSKEEYMNILKKIKKAMPGCAISTDIIVGFCGETEEEFEETLNMYREMEWDFCFLARYSPRKGTYSEKKLKDDVSPAEKASRWHRLNEVMLKSCAKKYGAFVGREVEVLVTSQDGQACRGRTPEFKEVTFNSGRQLIGKIVPLKITEARETMLYGELV
jgi:tRNA-2-methylthio-N6-dimethylallyladenosine synthase